MLFANHSSSLKDSQIPQKKKNRFTNLLELRGRWSVRTKKKWEQSNSEKERDRITCGKVVTRYSGEVINRSEVSEAEHQDLTAR